MDLSGVLDALARIADIRWQAAGLVGSGFAPLLEVQVGSAAQPGATSTALPIGPGMADALGMAPADEPWVQALPEPGRRYAPAIRRAAAAAGIDPRLLAALVWAESGFRPDATSAAGAIGLTQLMPGTAAALGVDPRDPMQNLEGGARYLAAQIQRFGSVELALAAYSAGPGAVAAAGGIPSAGTRAYVDRVLGYLRVLGGDPGTATVLAIARPASESAGLERPDARGASDRRLEPPRRSQDTPTSQDRTWRSEFLHLAPAFEGSVGAGHADPVRVDRPAEVRAANVRVLEALEKIRDQAPPSRVIVEVPELDGLRVLVDARGSTVHVRAIGGDPTGMWFDALVRDLGPGLSARGFDLADPHGRSSSAWQGPRDEPDAPPSQRSVHRSRRKGVRL